MYISDKLLIGVLSYFLLSLYAMLFKYILRAGHKSEEGYTEKDKTIEDLEKAIFYIKDEIERIKNDKGRV